MCDGLMYSKCAGPSRVLFLPSGLLDRNDVPDYLNGELPGDYGYDPLGLGAGGNVEKYRENELLHARWAMLAAAGIIIPEGLEANGAPIHGGTWFETGAEMLNGECPGDHLRGHVWCTIHVSADSMVELLCYFISYNLSLKVKIFAGGTLDYFAVPWGVVSNPLPLVVVIAIEVGLLGAVETYRRSGAGPAGFSPGVGKFDSSVFDGMDKLYPGGPFDPLKLGSDPEVLQELKVKEIKNGRLAMISVLAFAIQGYVTGEGPYANWSKHVADPFGYNLLTVLTGDDRVPTL